MSEKGGVNIIKYKWGIVILHYKVLDITRQCVDMLLELYDCNVTLVLVDNGSNDGSAEILQKQYSNNQNIYVIPLKENIGFSKGNNIGYMFLKKRGYHFIVLLNNDAFIFQRDFFLRIESEYDKSQFDILGPMILDAQYNVVNSYPQRPIHNTVLSVYIGQIVCIIKWVLSFFHLDIWLSDLLLRLQHNQKELSALQRHENVQISGCCLIFSSGYIDKFDGLNPKPFLYLEEEILFSRARKNSLKIVYTPEVQVIHLGEAATSHVNNNNNSKIRRFRYWNQFKSFLVLKKEIKV